MAEWMTVQYFLFYEGGFNFNRNFDKWVCEIKRKTDYNVSLFMSVVIRIKLKTRLNTIHSTYTHMHTYTHT